MIVQRTIAFVIVHDRETCKPIARLLHFRVMYVWMWDKRQGTPWYVIPCTDRALPDLEPIENRIDDYVNND